MTAPRSGQSDIFDSGAAQIIDRGYRHYDGERTGVSGAITSVTMHSVQRAMGLRRTTWAKVLPIGGALLAYVPAIVFVGIVSLVDSSRLEADFLPSYGAYYGYIIAAIMLFVALAAPEVLCTDRRSGMLGVYLAAPLNRDTYLVAKALSIIGVLSLVCLGPPLLILVANVVQSQGPTGIGDILLTTVRVFGAGIALTLLFTGVTMGVASLTDRKAVATAGVILLFLLTLSITGTLVAAGFTQATYAWSVTQLSLELAYRVHGEQSRIMAGVPSVTVWIAWAAWTFGGFALARRQLKVLPVTR